MSISVSQSLPSVCCFGARIVGGQVDRIEKGFSELGCILASFDKADLIFVNDSGGYNTVIEARQRGEINERAKVMFNVLDLAKHIPDFPLNTIAAQLSHADAVTCISHVVRKDIEQRLGFTCPVIYNPMRAVGYERLGKRLYKGLFVGRVNDPEKRCILGASALSILGYGWDDIVTVGREPPFYGGNYFDSVSDESLSYFYNASSFLMCPTRNAFLGLPIVEAMSCGCIPVVCNDLDVLNELLPSSIFPEYLDVTPDAPSLAKFVDRFQSDEQWTKMSERIYTHYQRELSRLFNPVMVAQRILDVYKTL